MPDEATAAQRPAETSKQHPAQQKSKPDGSGGSPFSAAADTVNEWEGFTPGRWQNAVDVRDFIQRNVAPYDGDESFLAGPSERTKAVWA